MKFFTVQAPLANNNWQQCGNSRYMSKQDAMAVYRNCSEYIACALFGIDPTTGEFEQFEVKRNY